MTPQLSYRKMLFHYLHPQRGRVLLMALLLLSGIGLQLVNPQILRYFIDSATTGGNLTALLLTGMLFIGIALSMLPI